MSGGVLDMEECNVKLKGQARGNSKRRNEIGKEGSERGKAKEAYIEVIKAIIVNLTCPGCNQRVVGYRIDRPLSVIDTTMKL